MRRTTPLLLTLALLTGCGDGDDAETATVVERTVTEAAPPPPGPTASVPAPHEPMPARCALEGLDAPGLTALTAEGVECSEAESVLLDWLQGCGGGEGECSPAPGYSCLQERFAGARSDVECVKGSAVVKFSFG
jgi:hypothetical protein